MAVFWSKCRKCGYTAQASGFLREEDPTELRMLRHVEKAHGPQYLTDDQKEKLTFANARIAYAQAQRKENLFAPFGIFWGAWMNADDSDTLQVVVGVANDIYKKMF